MHLYGYIIYLCCTDAKIIIVSDIHHIIILHNIIYAPYNIIRIWCKYHFGGEDDCNTVIESYFIQGVCDLPIAFFEFLISCYIRCIHLISGYVLCTDKLYIRRRCRYNYVPRHILLSGLYIIKFVETNKDS